MATKSGKVQIQDIKQGKVFYLVTADFPIVMPGIVGDGEIGSVKMIRVLRPPFYRASSKCMAFTYIDMFGKRNWVNLDEMQANHASFEVCREAPYFVLLKDRKAAIRFVKTFGQRSPTPRETYRTKLREAGLNAEQRGLS